ncbi:MAG: ribokinase [Anaerolineales bacterium]|jgi:ribokinase
MSIVVFGSINMDLVVRTPRLPARGETITGYTFQTFPGGKGANQAVACAQLGAEIFMVGRVGGDVFGSTLKAKLEAAGVDHTNVEVDTQVSSGVALIAVEESAENIIIVVPGANGQVSEKDLPRLERALEKSKILLLQLEIPLEMVVAAAKIAKEKGVKVILDPAPAQALPEEIYGLIDIITPNETEAALLVGFPVENKDDASRAVKVLEERGVGQSIIKMGSKGAFANIEGKETFFKAFPVTAVDTVAAGDAFNGALAVALSEEKPIQEAIRWGMAGGALSVTKEGAQPAMPERYDLLAILEKNL